MYVVYLGCFVFQMDASALAYKAVALVREGSLLTPRLEVPKGVLSSVVDFSTPQIAREPVIKPQDKNWRRFFKNFGGNVKTFEKPVDQSYVLVKTDTEFGSQRFEHCYVKDWEEAGNAGTSWLTTSIAAHQDCQLSDACLLGNIWRTWTGIIGRTWTLCHVDFDPASPSVTSLVCELKLWLVSTQTDLAREL